jgi:GT2 family glycosyltransferase
MLGGTGAGLDLLIRRSVFEAVGGFEDHFRGMYDEQALLFKVFLRYPIYISSRAWLYYRQHDASCCAQTSRADYWRLRRVFLDWLHEDLAPFDDPRVGEAVRRARRELPYRRFTAPARELYGQFSARLPDRFKRRVKRTLAAGAVRRGRPRGESLAG